MADQKSVERIVLKILAGAQSGAEVSLEPGDYIIGTGVDDDIQFIDVSMKPAHARLRLAPGKIEIRNGAGAFHTATASGLAGDKEWQEVQPLDVITTGTTRFAFGPPTAHWSTIADHGDLASASSRAAAQAPGGAAPGLLNKVRSLAIPISLLILLIAISGSLLIAVKRGALYRSDHQVNDVATLRKAFDQFPFGRSIAVEQEVDGAIYVTGFVDTPVERRAIVGAIDKSGVSARLRLGVLQIMRSEMDGLIKAERVNVTYSLSSSGDLTLQGVILDPGAAEKFVDEVRQNVVGVREIVSKIRTAPILLQDIQKLAHLSEIDDTVVFRLDGTAVDANGVISVNKIDAWVGFLQAYAKRFGNDIGLRSYVQLQTDPGSPSAQSPASAGLPVLLGAGMTGPGINLDVNRLRNGERLSDAFVGGPRIAKPAPKSTASTSALAKPAVQASKPADPPAPLAPGPIASRHQSWAPPPASAAPQAPEKTPAEQKGRPVEVARAGSDISDGFSFNFDPKAGAGTASPTLLPPDADGNPKQSPRPALPASFPHDVGDMTDRAGSLMTRWLKGSLMFKAGTEAGSQKDAALETALNTLANDNLGLASPPAALSEASKEMFAHKYLPLFALSRQSTIEAAKRCRPGSRLSLDDLPAALFWLDLMSTTNAITLRDFDRNAQGFILEAALNPDLVAQCLRRDESAAALIPNSIYLAEAARNPEFVRFVTQSLQPFALDVTGASLWQPRFVQLRDGSKLREGEAPDASSRIDTIGELGASVLLSDGYSAVIYGQGINWLATR